MQVAKSQVSRKMSMEKKIRENPEEVYRMVRATLRGCNSSGIKTTRKRSPTF
jgi:hypothetical protein